MGKIMYKNIPFTGAIKTDHIELTQLQYDALSAAEKNDPDKVYFVRDADPSETSELLDIMYPIGSYYETADMNFDPNVKWGGNWVSETLTDNKIVEEGKTNDWTYRKWSSGIAECWKLWSSNSFSPSGAVGGFYGRVLPSSGYTSFPSGLFISTPIVNFTLDSWGSGYFWASARQATSDGVKMTLFRNDNASSAATGSLYVIGNWKAYEAPAPIYKWTRLD